MNPRRTLIVLIAGAICSAFGCRAVLGIEERPLLPDEDASTVPGVEADADANAEAAVGTWCESQPPDLSLCSDFDRGELTADFPESNSSGSIITGGATITPDDVQFASAPRSARFTVPALVTDKSYASAMLVKEVGLTGELPRYLIVRLDLRIDTVSIPEGRGRVTLVNLNFGRDVGAIGVYIDAVGLNLEVYDGVASVERVPFAETLPPGEWRTLSLRIRNYPVDGGTGGDVVALLGGLSAQLTVPATFQAPPLLPRLAIGVHTARGPMETFRYSVDNVRAEVKPGSANDP